MPTHDYIIANGTGAAVRADINLALSAIVSLNSSASEPGTMYAYQLWADTAAGLLKIRNGANSAWVTLRQLDGDFSIVAVEDGLQATPSLTFTNDLNTGIFRPGNDSLAIVTGATRAITITSTQAVGIQTANPSSALHVAGNARVGADDVTDAHLQIGKGATGNRNSYIDIVADTTYTDYGLRIIRNNTGANATSELKHRGTGALNFTTQEAAPIVFNTTNSPALTILAGGNVGIATSSPVYKLDVVVESNKGIGAFAPASSTGITDFSAGGVGWTFTRPNGAYTHSIYSYDTAAGAKNNFVIQSRNDIVFINGGGPTASTETMRIVEGKVGIGSNGPGGTLDIKAAASTHPLIVQGPSSEFARIDSSGRLLVGTITQVGNANGGILQLGSGITFPATAVAATDVNTLDDYEEGTWTPEMADAFTGGNTAASYTTVFGDYVKIGRLVYLSGKVVYPVTTGMTSANEIFIRNLPFVAATGNAQCYGAVFVSGLTYPAGYTFVQAWLNPNDGNTIRFVSFGSGQTFSPLKISNVTSGSSLLYFSIVINIF